MSVFERVRAAGLIAVIFVLFIQRGPAAEAWHVTAGGCPVSVIETPMPENCLPVPERHPYHYASFVCENETEVTVEGLKLSTPMTFRLKPGSHRVIDPAGRHGALVIAANPLDRAAPKPDDPNVRYFGPGHHHVETLELKSGETLYLAEGAWLEACVVGKGENITVAGPGVLSGACWKHRHGPNGRGLDDFNREGRLVLLSGRNIIVRDVTIYSSFGWTLVLKDVDGACVDNVKILGGRVINDDGIDICSSRNVTIRNSFVRTQDDAIAPKWWCEDLVVTNCTVWSDDANNFRIGFECDPCGKGYGMRRQRYVDLDLRYPSAVIREPHQYWAHNFIHLQAVNEQRFEDIVFENIRVPHAQPGDVLFNARTQKVVPEDGISAESCFSERAGTIDGVVLKNFSIAVDGFRSGVERWTGRGKELRKEAFAGDSSGLAVYLEAMDDAHPIRNVRFENIPCVGPVTTSGAVEPIRGLNKTKTLNSLDMRWTFGAHEPYTMYRRIGRRSTGDIDGNALWLGDWLNWWDENAPAAMEEMGFNWCHSRFYKGMGWEEEKKDFPNVQKFVRNCHKHDVNVLAYVQFGTLYPEAMKHEIPDLESWSGYGEDGAHHYYFGSGYFRWMPCITCNEWVDYLKRICTIALTEGGFDGIMFDNFFAKPCYCARCEKHFNAYLCSLPDRKFRFGFDDLSQVSQPRLIEAACQPDRLRKDPVFQAWCDWRVTTLTDIARRLSEHIKSVKPDAVVSANISSYRRDNANVARGLALDLYELDRYFDLVLMQSSNFPGLMEKGEIHGRVRDMKMANARGKVCLHLCDEDSRETPETLRRYELVLLEDTIFGGIPTDRSSMNPSREPGYLPKSRRATRKPILKRLNRQIAEHRAAFTAPSYQPVKLFFSPTTIRYSADIDKALSAAEEILLRNRVPWGYAVSEGAKGFTIPSDCEVLILPGTLNLAEPEIAAVLDYAKKGGRLVVTGEAGRFDEIYAERFTSPLMDALKALKLPNVVMRDEVDMLPYATLGWTYCIAPPKDGGKALLADIAATGWKAPVTFSGLAPHVFAEYKKDGSKLYVHLLNFNPETPVKGARAGTARDALSPIADFSFNSLLEF